MAADDRDKPAANVDAPFKSLDRDADQRLSKTEAASDKNAVGAFHGEKVSAATGPGRPRGDQRWSTLLQNHAQAIVACDFSVAVTSTFRVLYVFIVIEHHSRRLIHYNVTAHPSAQWTLQQLREGIGYERRYEYLVHDRDSIFSAELDESIQRLGLRVLKSPLRRAAKSVRLCSGK